MRVLFRDATYQGDRAFAITMEKISGAVSDLWVRFCDAVDPTYWTAKLFATREEAIADPLGTPLATCSDYEKAVYSHPLQMTLTFSNSVVAEIHDVGAQPNPWLGEVFGYVSTPAVRLGTRIVEALRARTSTGKVFDAVKPSSITLGPAPTATAPPAIAVLPFCETTFNPGVPDDAGLLAIPFRIDVETVAGDLMQSMRQAKELIGSLISILTDEEDFSELGRVIVIDGETGPIADPKRAGGAVASITLRAVNVVAHRDEQ